MHKGGGVERIHAQRLQAEVVFSHMARLAQCVCSLAAGRLARGSCGLACGAVVAGVVTEAAMPLHGGRVGARSWREWMGWRWRCKRGERGNPQGECSPPPSKVLLRELQ